ncbi:hypothetical protein [Humidisolicoccus flavus]|uniref:hypothetical protein n=1 Tax=Humidisolicoccus flavus TaxID=3111414 RepID=UPI00324EA7E0
MPPLPPHDESPNDRHEDDAENELIEAAPNWNNEPSDEADDPNHSVDSSQNNDSGIEIDAVPSPSEAPFDLDEDTVLRPNAHSTAGPSLADLSADLDAPLIEAADGDPATLAPEPDEAFDDTIVARPQDQKTGSPQTAISLPHSDDEDLDADTVLRSELSNTKAAPHSASHSAPPANSPIESPSPSRNAEQQASQNTAPEGEVPWSPAYAPSPSSTPASSAAQSFGRATNSASTGFRFDPKLREQSTAQNGAAQHVRDHGNPERANANPQRRSKLGLWLGIGIPVAALAIIGIVAAMIFPRIMLNHEASVAAETFTNEQSAWDSAFSESALEPYFGLSGESFAEAILLGADDDRSDEPAGASLVAACEAISEVEAAYSSTTWPTVPREPDVEGAEDVNEEYVAAAEEWTATQNKYEASAEFVETSDPAFADALSICTFTQEQRAIDTALSEAFRTELRPFVTMSNGDTEEFVFEDQTITFTCSSSGGCVSFVNSETRVKYADAVERVRTESFDRQIENLTNNCPNGFDELCVFERNRLAEAKADVSAFAKAMREQMPTDPVLLASAPGTTPAIAQALSATSSHEEAQATQLAKELKAVGFEAATFDGALAESGADALDVIRDHAVSIHEPS